MATSVDYHATLASLRAQQASQPLSILALAEPLTETAASSQKQQNDSRSQSQPPQSPGSSTSRANQQQQQQQRPSDVSANSESQAGSDLNAADSSLLTPASLSADLAHYRDLFSKLRFSYLEQVTKEKYLRSIVGDPPLVVSHNDNLQLEDKLAVMKAELQTKKRGVDALVAEMERQARLLAQRYDSVKAGLDVLDRVPPQLDQLRHELVEIQAEIAARKKERNIGEDDQNETDPRMNMALEPTLLALEDQRARNAEIDRQIDLLKKQMPAKDRDVEKMDRELADLEKRRNESTRVAVELRRRREQGGRDEMEDLGRWYRGSEAVLRGVLGLGVEA